MQVPKVGDMIYVESAFYIDHGEDDRVGGLAKVVKIQDGISAGKKEPFVVVEAFPYNSFNWCHLAPKQEELKKRFGRKKAYSDPDCPTGCTRKKRCWRHLDALRGLPLPEPGK